MNNVIIEQLVKPVKIELSNTTILDGRDDSWWNTPEYWEEKELDGVRSIIFYSISDSTKVLDAVKLHLTEDPKNFNYHDEVMCPRKKGQLGRIIVSNIKTTNFSGDEKEKIHISI